MTFLWEFTLEPPAPSGQVCEWVPIELALRRSLAGCAPDSSACWIPARSPRRSTAAWVWQISWHFCWLDLGCLYTAVVPVWCVGFFGVAGIWLNKYPSRAAGRLAKLAESSGGPLVAFAFALASRVLSDSSGAKPLDSSGASWTSSNWVSLLHARRNARERSRACVFEATPAHRLAWWHMASRSNWRQTLKSQPETSKRAGGFVKT